MAQFTKEEFFGKWHSVAKKFEEAPAEKIDEAQIRQALKDNNVPHDFIEAHFKDMIGYCHGRTPEELDHEKIEQYAQEVYEKAKECGLASE